MPVICLGVISLDSKFKLSSPDQYGSIDTWNIKIGPKWIIHISVVWRPTELKFGIYADYPKYITGTYFGAIVAILDFCF